MYSELMIMNPLHFYIFLKKICRWAKLRETIQRGERIKKWRTRHSRKNDSSKIVEHKKDIFPKADNRGHCMMRMKDFITFDFFIFIKEKVLLIVFFPNVAES